MVYTQYNDEYAYTGNQELYKNRVPNNAFVGESAETIQFPYAYDVFVNKENIAEGSFGVREAHTQGELEGGTKLYLDHRIALSAAGVPTYPTEVGGDGTIDGTSYNMYEASVEYSVPPTGAVFEVQYTARGDKNWDSHINVVQNAIMRIERTIGLHENDPVQSSLISLPLVTTWNPATQAELTSVKENILSNIVLLGHLENDIKIGSTDGSIADARSHVITLGNPDAGEKDSIIIDATSLVVNTGSEGGTLIYSASTGDSIYFTGESEFASRMTVGMPHAVTGTYVGTGSSIAESFYNDAMLRVHGDIYFAGDVSGEGSLTLTLSTGEVVDIIGGNMTVDNLIVDESFLSHAAATFEKRLYVQKPGYFETNNDITLTDKGSNQPTTIDSLDPSYAKAAIDSNATLPGAIGTPVYEEPFVGTSWDNPYLSGQKEHPILRTIMYPMLGGWMFTGTVNYDVAAEYSHKNVILANANLRASESGYGDQGDWFSYSPGLFSPGDTYIEINNGGSDRFAYPIYHHEVFTGDVGGVNTATGLNMYVVADDNAFEEGIAGQEYRIFQPSNAPMGYLRQGAGWGAAAPTVDFGIAASNYYDTFAQKGIDFKTNPSNIGPSAGSAPWSIYKRLKNDTVLTCSIKEALQRNIDHDAINDLPGGYSDITTPINGIAYIYATTHSSYNTLDEEVTLIASPSPYGICADNTWGAGRDLHPGQWTIVGEVVASTNMGQAGNSWTHVETVGYRANGIYDSCWVPTSTYRLDAVGAGWNPPERVEDLGRCLPLFQDDSWVSSTDMWRDETYEGRMNFFVEHNLGPIRSLSDISLEVYVGSIKLDTAVHPLSGNGIVDWASAHQMSATAASVWGGAPGPYGTRHELRDPFSTPAWNSRRGFLRKLPDAQLAFLDSRFARISIFEDEYMKEPDESLPEYIRVVMKRLA